MGTSVWTDSGGWSTRTGGPNREYHVLIWCWWYSWLDKFNYVSGAIVCLTSSIPTCCCGASRAAAPSSPNCRVHKAYAPCRAESTLRGYYICSGGDSRTFIWNLNSSRGHFEISFTATHLVAMHTTQGRRFFGDKSRAMVGYRPSFVLSCSTMEANSSASSLMSPGRN